MIADDEPFLVRFLSFALKKEGYEVLVALDGQDAFEKIMSFRPDLVLLDLRLPLLHGFELLRRIKSDTRLKDTCIILFTANEEDQNKVLAAGANLMMTKPFSLKDLMTDVRRLLNSPSESHAG